MLDITDDTFDYVKIKQCPPFKKLQEMHKPEARAKLINFFINELQKSSTLKNNHKFRLSSTGTYFIISKKEMSFLDEQFLDIQLSETVIPIENIHDV